MKMVMTIPTYWGRGSDVGWQEGDAVYDHATSLDTEGTLVRTLESMDILEDRDFQLVILACATAEEIETQVEEKVRSIVSQTRPGVETFVFSNSQLRAVRSILQETRMGECATPLSLQGYSNIRNACLFVPLVMGGEVVVLIDDDEVFEDPHFVHKAREFIGGRFLGTTIDGVAGYYVNADGEYYDKVKKQPWMTYWDRFGSKAEAFDEIIGAEKPRLKRTPFAFGGCMVIHRNLLRVVPFDPRITRGEDTDYVINARMFGFNFFLDNQLSIKHLPPPKMHPVWKRFREDIYRLLYDRSKIVSQEKRPNMVLVEPEDFDPYPGAFLKEDLEDKILKTNLILALDYLADDDVECCKKTLENIWLARTDAVPRDNTFLNYLAFQERWRGLCRCIEEKDELRSQILDLIHRGGIYYEEEKQKRARLRELYSREREPVTPDELARLEFFADLTDKELKVLSRICDVAFYTEDEIIFEEGQPGSALYIVRKGTVRVVRGERFDEVVFTEINSGQQFGEVSLIADTAHTATVVANEPTELIVIRKEEFFKILNDSDEMARKLLLKLAGTLGERLRENNERYLSLKERTETDVYMLL
ncbi:MAG: cyclic nucleotide-binding domain-containing protein [Chloroflexota bacterium]|nr:cyclic nucleotide-binding domain-containing protein [Chloroflexota bacterium]